MFGEKLFLSPPSYKRCFYPSFHTSQSTELAIFNWIPCFLMLRGWDKASKRMCLSVCQYILEVILSIWLIFKRAYQHLLFLLMICQIRWVALESSPPVFLSEYFIGIRNDPMSCSFCQLYSSRSYLKAYFVWLNNRYVLKKVTHNRKIHLSLWYTKQTWWNFKRHCLWCRLIYLQHDFLVNLL